MDFQNEMQICKDISENAFAYLTIAFINSTAINPRSLVSALLLKNMLVEWHW
jgi:hypothetical protein